MPEAFKDKLTPLDLKVQELARAAAHKHQLTAEQFKGFSGDFFAAVNAEAMVANPVDGAAEVAKLGGQDAYARIAGDNKAWIENGRAAGRFTAEEVQEFDILLVTAAGQKLVEKLRATAPAYVAAPPGMGAAGTGSFGVAQPRSLEDAQALVSDPRYRTTSDKYDARFRAWADGQIDALGQRPAA